MAGKVERPGSASALAASFIVRWPTGAKLLLILSIALLPLAIIAVFATLQTTRNADSEVIRADGTVIDGMFCAGETSCNSAFMGFTISNAITWGRIAGAGAAAYAAK